MQNIQSSDRTDISRNLALFLIALLLIGGTFIRTYKLTTVPAGAAFDTVWDFADALRISRGLPFYGYFDMRSEPILRWILGASYALIGPSIYSGQLVHIYLALFAIATTYTAGLALLRGRNWQRLGAIVAAGAVAASVPNLFISRNTYRVALLLPVIALTFMFLLWASRKGTKWAWLRAGFTGGLSVHTYLAGIFAPPWVIGFVLHQLIFSRTRRWLSLLWTVLGMLPPLIVWLILVKLVPDLFFRVDATTVKSGYTVSYIISGFLTSFREMFLTGYKLPIYNTPDTPFLNPAFSLLALIGAALALWRWRHADGALFLGGIILFTLPASLSVDPLHPIRLAGTLPLLALLAGWGAAWLIQRLIEIHISKALVYLSTAALLILSLTYALMAYQGYFTNPAYYNPPEYWFNVPHNYMIAHMEGLEWLENVKEPTYVPLGVLDSPAAYYILQRRAFPTVTTWARHPLPELPAGQFATVTYDYYHNPLPVDAACIGLLLPSEQTIVILPCSTTTPLITVPAASEMTVVKSPSFDWDIVRVSPVVSQPFVPPQFVTVADQPPTIGDGLELIAQESPTTLEPGKQAAILLYWKVTASQPADIFSVVQLLDLDNARNFANSDQHTLGYVYPSVRWQAGDIIPDLHRLDIPGDLPQGVYRWAAGAHVPPSQTGLTVKPKNSILHGLWLWGAMRNPPPAASTPPSTITKLDAQFDDHIKLAGYDLTKTPTQWTLKLYWQVQSPPLGDYTIFVHAQSGDSIVAQQDSKPMDGRLPTWSWVPQEVVTTTHTLTLPPGTTPHMLYVGMYSFPSLARLGVSQNGQTILDSRVAITP